MLRRGQKHENQASLQILVVSRAMISFETRNDRRLDMMRSFQSLSPSVQRKICSRIFVFHHFGCAYLPLFFHACYIPSELTREDPAAAHSQLESSGESPSTDGKPPEGRRPGSRGIITGGIIGMMLSKLHSPRNCRHCLTWRGGGTELSQLDPSGFTQLLCSPVWPRPRSALLPQ